MKICSDNFDIILANLGLSSSRDCATNKTNLWRGFKSEQQQQNIGSSVSLSEKFPASSNLGCRQFVSLLLALKIQRILWDFLFLALSCKLTFLKGISFVSFRAIGSFGQCGDLKDEIGWIRLDEIVSYNNLLQEREVNFPRDNPKEIGFQNLLT